VKQKIKPLQARRQGESCEVSEAAYSWQNRLYPWMQNPFKKFFLLIQVCGIPRCMEDCWRSEPRSPETVAERRSRLHGWFGENSCSALPS
jgi:hypothetical protein